MATNDTTPRIHTAVLNDIKPGIERSQTAWFRYDWNTREKQFFTGEDFDRDPNLNIIPRTNTERVYKFTLDLPPIMDDRSEIINNDAPGPIVIYDDATLDPSKSICHQIARNFFGFGCYAYPGCSPQTPFESRWLGSPFDDSTNSFVMSMSGHTFMVVVTEIHSKESKQNE
jgi:hypothetical protein